MGRSKKTKNMGAVEGRGSTRVGKRWGRQGGPEGTSAEVSRRNAKKQYCRRGRWEEETYPMN